MNLNSIAQKLNIGSGNLRFASADILHSSLGVKQGAVNIYALLNDKTAQNVILLLDERILKPTQPDKLWFHPMQNDASTALTHEHLQQFLELTHHKPVLMTLE